MSSDERTDRQPPNAEAVAGRAIALAALCCRGFTDSGENDPDRQLYHAVIDWFDRSRIEQHLNPAELHAFRAPPGMMDPKLATSLTWECEGLAVFAWALKRIELPLHYEQVDPPGISSTVGLFAEDPQAIIRGAALRARDELEVYRELIYAIQVRMNAHLKRRSAFDFAEHIEPAWLKTLSIEPPRLMVNNDLAIGGRPINQVAADELRPYFWAVCQRHRAAIWLSGEEPNHWDTQADI